MKLEIVAVAKGASCKNDADALIAFAQAAGNVGGLLKQPQEGPLLDGFMAALQASGAQISDAQLPFALLLAIHDTDAAKQTARKSGYLTSMVMKHAQAQLEKYIDNRKVVKHSEFSKTIESMITNPNKHGIKLKADECEHAYLPVVQSGAGPFELRVGAESDDNRLHHGVIMIQLGAKYHGRITNICRTFFVNPDAECDSSHTPLK